MSRFHMLGQEGHYVVVRLSEKTARALLALRDRLAEMFDEGVDYLRPVAIDVDSTSFTDWYDRQTFEDLVGENEAWCEWTELTCPTLCERLMPGMAISDECLTEDSAYATITQEGILFEMNIDHSHHEMSEYLEWEDVVEAAGEWPEEAPAPEPRTVVTGGMDG